ncbi:MULTISPECIES: DUF3375 domain-containing protein [Halomonadaceae]|uniref:DUF3375 domain-containing protein n=2 Tax=Halomonadaceae TaxID=28256 RepID=A0AAP9NSC2_9GAMM|nr:MULTISPECIES: DUF3375 domain-containing protein [Halomonas]QKS27407.1 hypothetical protein FX987_05228 [Halomonas titanicae]CDG53783.1 conserved hypothetical protein [Halomonas sp. A3H3]SDI86501.1 Protein of unknown function [Halomonas titanicae]
MDYDYLASLRKYHPAWRLLLADHAPLIIAFVHRSFIEPNVRSLPEQELAARLEDYLFHLRQGLGEGHFPKPAREYLNDWASDERGWLRRYFPADSDEPHYDLIPAVEQAIQWLAGLEQRTFVGAESRLKLVFDLLRDISQNSETDPETRIAELSRRRAAIDAEIEEIRTGHMAFMDPTRLRERFLQATDTAQALLADFRQVEQNFRDLDRQVRERIATWEGGKAAILEEVLGQRNAITDSDQGRSFRAFWDFLMSADRQQELTELLESILSLEPVAELNPDPRLRRIHYDWLTAGEATQRTVARLSEQLRRYLDDQAWLENRRIMDLLHGLEQHALAVRENLPTTPFMTVEAPAPDVQLPMDRPLFSPPIKPHIEQAPLEEGAANIAADPLFEQVYVDKERLRARLRQALQTQRQISLESLLQRHPLEQGLAELVTWLSLATGEELGLIDETQEQVVYWTDDQGQQRRATLPAVIFVSGHQGARP